MKDTHMDRRMMYMPLDSSHAGLWGILAPIIMSFVVSILYIIIGGMIGMEPEAMLSTVPWVYIANLIIELGFLVVYILYNKYNRVDWVRATRLGQSSNVWIYVICAVLGLVLPLCCSGIIGLWSIGLDGIGYKLSELSVPLGSVGELILALFVVAIVPAICEELVFRGIVLNGLRSRGKWVAVLLSALLFGLMHNNIEQLPYTFALGVVLGTLAYETGSILPGILTHAMNNAIVLISMYLSNNGIWSGDIVLSNIMWLDAIITAIIGVALVIGVVWVIKRLAKYRDDSQLQIDQYYENKLVLHQGVQVKLSEYAGMQTKKIMGLAIIIGILMLVISLITHF